MGRCSRKTMEILYFFVFTNLIIICDADKYSDHLIDDVSISRNTQNELDEIPNNETRAKMVRTIKERKYYKTRLDNLEPVHGYYLFKCAIESSRNDLESVYPTFSHGGQRKYLTHGIRGDVAFPEDLQTIRNLFRKLEDKYNAGMEYHASKNVEPFFYTMLAFLRRCTIERFENNLMPSVKDMGLAIRKILFEGVENNTTVHSELILKFSSSYARIRQAFDNFHHTYARYVFKNTETLQTMKNRRNVSLPEVLDYMGLLEVFTFTEEDIRYLNILRRFFQPKDAIFSTASFEIVNGEGVKVEGILPYLETQYCPRLPIDIK